MLDVSLSMNVMALQVGVELGFGRKPNPFQLFLLTWLGFFAS
jgi:hypothetical protein